MADGRKLSRTKTTSAVLLQVNPVLLTAVGTQVCKDGRGLKVRA